MKILRFIFPFLFERNWYTGSWELSKVRLAWFLFGLLLLLVVIVIAYFLQAPVVYTNQ